MIIFTESGTVVVECDNCEAHCKKVAKDPGQAAENARNEGFITIPGATISSPRSWLCTTCSHKK